jgi:hypothetical protein
MSVNLESVPWARAAMRTPAEVAPDLIRSRVT